jgi:hypothetical protein
MGEMRLSGIGEEGGSAGTILIENDWSKEPKNNISPIEKLYRRTITIRRCKKKTSLPEVIPWRIEKHLDFLL